MPIVWAKQYGPHTMFNQKRFERYSVKRPVNFHLKLKGKHLDKFQLSGLFPAQIISDNILILNKSEQSADSPKICSNILLRTLHCIVPQDDNASLTYPLLIWKWLVTFYLVALTRIAATKYRPLWGEPQQENAGIANKQTRLWPLCCAGKVPSFVTAAVEEAGGLSTEERDERVLVWSRRKIHSWKHNGILMHESKWAFVWTKCLGNENLCELVVLSPPLLYTD